MTDTVATFLTSYLLMPILAVIMGIVAYFYAKKNKLLTNRKFIFFVLLGSVALALPALFGFIHYWFMPYVYICLQIVYLILGYYNVKIIRSFMGGKEGKSNSQKENKGGEEKDKKKSFTTLMFVQFLMMFAGAAFFSLIFNLCNELKYGLWACTCLLPFLLPPVLWETYNKYMSIPHEVYKCWEYTTYDLSSFELMDYDKLMVMEIEIFKSPDQAIPIKVKVKAPDNMSFGEWFYKFLTDYNVKSPEEPIILYDGGESYKWIFYVKRSFFLPRKYIDYELSINDNKIKEQDTIMAKRVYEIGPEE